MNQVIVSVGSNMDPLENIGKAADILDGMDFLVSVSRFIRTSPEGFKEQPDFLNGAFYIETSLAEPELKSCLKKIEARLGRIRTENKNGPRTIDLDIVAFNGEIIDPDYHRYPFVKSSTDEIFEQIRSRKWQREIKAG